MRSVDLLAIRWASWTATPTSPTSPHSNSHMLAPARANLEMAWLSLTSWMVRGKQARRAHDGRDLVWLSLMHDTSAADPTPRRLM